MEYKDSFRKALENDLHNLGVSEAACGFFHALTNNQKYFQTLGCTPIRL